MPNNIESPHKEIIPAKDARYTYFVVRMVCWIHLFLLITAGLIWLSTYILVRNHAQHPSGGFYYGLAIGAALFGFIYAMVRKRFK